MHKHSDELTQGFKNKLFKLSFYSLNNNIIYNII